MSFEKSLNGFRSELDQIDETLFDLLEKRFIITDEIGKLKKQYNQPIDQLDRESQIKKKLKDKLQGFSHVNEILDLYDLVFELSKKSQKNV